VGTSGGVPWFKLRPRALSRTLDTEGHVTPPLSGSGQGAPSAAAVRIVGITGIVLVIVGAFLLGPLPVGGVIIGISGAVLGILAILGWRDRRGQA
jgi:hypothetical protein